MRLKFKTVLASIALAIGLLMMPQVNALADGPEFFEFEPNNASFDANKVVLYDSVYSNLTQGDIDWYKIYIPRSDRYVFRFTGRNVAPTLKVNIYDASSNVVFSGSPDANGKIIFSGTLNGLYYVQVSDENNANCNAGYDFEFYPENSGGNPLYRFAGANRYETSYSIFKNNWSYCNWIVIATGEDFPDALGATPLARYYNAPVILTEPKALSSEVENHIKKTGAKNAFIIGGYGAVSKDVEDKLTSMGIACKRLAGQDRYETSLQIAKEFNIVGTVSIVTGEDFPDALTVAPYAANCLGPILLVDKNRSNDKVLQYIKDKDVQIAVIVGGTGVVPQATETSIKSIIGNESTIRAAGADRYETNINFLKTFSKDFRLNQMYFATGLNFPDAMSGSVVAAVGFNPVILIDKDVNAATRKYLEDNRSQSFGNCIFGGEGVIPTATVKQFFPYSN